MRVAFYVTETFYSGSHGMFNCGIYDVQHQSEIDEIGSYLGEELIESYSCLAELYQDGETEYIYDIYYIPDCYDDVSDDKLENFLYNYGLADFIERYSDL